MPQRDTEDIKCPTGLINLSQTMTTTTSVHSCLTLDQHYTSTRELTGGLGVELRQPPLITYCPHSGRQPPPTREGMTPPSEGWMTAPSLACPLLYCAMPLYCVVLHCTVLRRAAPSCVVLCYAVLHRAVLCCAVLHCTVLHRGAPCCTVLCCNDCNEWH